MGSLCLELLTPRLRLRSWRTEDVAPFAAMCADPCVMRFFDSTLTSDDAAAAVHRYTAREAAAGFCMWAMERVSDGVFLGLAGLQHVPYDAPFNPAVEIGWRLARAHWGRGYATEAARASLDYGFGRCGLREVVAIAVAANIASVAVMERVACGVMPTETSTIPPCERGILCGGMHYTA